MRIKERRLRQMIREALSVEQDPDLNWRSETMVDLVDAKAKYEALMTEISPKNHKWEIRSIRLIEFDPQLGDPELKAKLENEGKVSLVQKAEAFAEVVKAMGLEMESLIKPFTRWPKRWYTSRVHPRLRPTSAEWHKIEYERVKDTINYPLVYLDTAFAFELPLRILARYRKEYIDNYRKKFGKDP